MYDRITLLNIFFFTRSDVGGPGLFPPPLLIHLLAHLCRHPADLPRRKRHRRRGKRRGLTARLKTGPAHENRTPHSSFLWGDQLHGYGVGMCLPESLSQQPHVIITAPSSMRRRRIYYRDHRGGVNLRNLRSLCRSTQPGSDSSLPKFALINARSLVNKTFILNEFFTAQALDYFCVTETWIKSGEVCSLAELLPHGCDFF